MPDKTIYERIDQYLLGGMSGDELTTFENELQNDSTLRTKVSQEKLTHELVFQASMIQLTSEIEDELKTIKKRKKALKTSMLIGVLLAGSAGLLWLFPLKREANNAQPPIDQLTPPQQIDTTLKTKVIIDTKPTFSPQPVNSIQNPAQVKTVESKTQGIAEPITAEQLIYTDTITDIDLPAQEKHQSTAPLALPLIPCEDMSIILDYETPCIGEETSVNFDIVGGQPPHKIKIDNVSYAFDETVVTSAGLISISISDANQCLSLTALEIDEQTCLEIEKAFNANNSTWLYPSENEITLQLRSMAGDVVYEVTQENPEWNGNDLQGDRLPQNAYLYFVLSNGQIIDQGEVTLVRQ